MHTFIEDTFDLHECVECEDLTKQRRITIKYSQTEEVAESTICEIFTNCTECGKVLHIRVEERS